jgi:acetylornithine/succinyldiaminopimelate/putrescine aminotransferase
MLPGAVRVPYNDLAAARAAVDDETAGVFVECIQGEGGVNVAGAEFLRGLRALCDERGLILVCDEVWTAPARTGRWFAYQHFDIEPDVMTLAKALGGGAPVAACVAAPKVQDVLAAGRHGCTMGGNPLCAAAGAATMRLIEQEGLVEQAAVKGERIMSAVSDAAIACVKEVRGKGMMIAVELDRPARDVFLACLDKGLFVACAGENVIRLAPPLIIEDVDISEGLDILFGVLRA